MLARMLLLIASCQGAILGLGMRTPSAPLVGRARRAGVLSADETKSPCVIKVVGVGGGGGNAVNRMIQFGTDMSDAVEYWTINTDIQALDSSLSPNRLGLGAGTSRGLGAGGNPDMGAMAAEESYEQIAKMVSGSDMVFVVGGMCASRPRPPLMSLLLADSMSVLSTQGWRHRLWCRPGRGRGG